MLSVGVFLLYLSLIWMWIGVVGCVGLLGLWVWGGWFCFGFWFVPGGALGLAWLCLNQVWWWVWCCFASYVFLPFSLAFFKLLIGFYRGSYDCILSSVDGAG